MTRTTEPDALAASLDRHLMRVGRRRARRGLPPPQVRVEAPGFLYRSGDDLPFHAASIGKLATTALIAQGIEAGRFHDDTPVADLLPASELAGLFRGSRVTIAHLLTHTSGVADYFEDPTTSGAPFIEQVITDSDRMWTPAEMIAFSRELQTPVGDPGERFHYSDTGFALLGRVLEESSGRSYEQLVRERILDPAGMGDSTVWLREPGPGRIAPAWLRGTEVSGFRSISLGWAAGGIVSTTDDLARLGVALTDGTLIRRETWQRLAMPLNRLRPGIHYGSGVMQLRFDGFMPLLRGLARPVGHLGSLSTHLMVDTERETSVVLNFHDGREMSASCRTHIRIAQGLAGLPRRT